MRKLAMTAAIGAACLTLAACGDYDENEQAYDAAGNEAYGAGAGEEAYGNAAGGTQTAYAWPEGARIVEEQGVTYRIDPGGTRVRLDPTTESRIVVEDGVRFRVDPDGSRVRIDDQGIAVRVDDDDVDADVRVGDDTSLEVNTN